MAEGDTLVRLARRLEPALTGREITAASAPNPRSGLRRHASRLEGRQVESIETRGKHLLIHLDDGLAIHSHLGMNGSCRVSDVRGCGKPDRNAWSLLQAAPKEGGGTTAARAGQFGGTTLRLLRRGELPRVQAMDRPVHADPGEAVVAEHPGQRGAIGPGTDLDRKRDEVARAVGKGFDRRRHRRRTGGLDRRSAVPAEGPPDPRSYGPAERL